MGIPDKTGKKVYEGFKHVNAECSDDSMDFNMRMAKKSARAFSVAEEVQDDYSIEGKAMPRSARARK